jgi:glyoxylate/hydroxypyruvate reductase A
MTTLAILTNAFYPATHWQEVLARECPHLKIIAVNTDSDQELARFKHSADLSSIDHALVWCPPSGVLAALPNLKMVFSIATGVDHILKDPLLPAHLPIVRMVDPRQQQTMAEMVLLSVLHCHRRMPQYQQNQQNALWDAHPPRYTPDFSVGLLGLGPMAMVAAARLKDFGFQLHGWSRQPKQLDGITCWHGADGLLSLLARCDYTVVLLPQTPQTQNLLGKTQLMACKQGAYLINLARGGLVVEQDLWHALDHGPLAGAWLDVFHHEPLPATHGFWQHPKITITPHVAARLIPETAALVVAENLKRLEQGLPPIGLFDRSIGY